MAVAAPTTTLRKLPAVTWGELLRRARITTGVGAKLTQARAARWIGRVTNRPIDPVTIGRLEALDVAPADRGRRRTAYLLTILYRLEPSELGLGDDDGPGDRAVEELRGFSTNWYRMRTCVRHVSLSAAA